MVGLLDDSRFAHQHPWEFQEAQRAAAAAHSARERHADEFGGAEDAFVNEILKAPPQPPLKWPFCAAGALRPRFSARDFHTRFAPKETIDSWFSRFPVIRQRNFYVLQEHAATAHHWDLRLQLDGGLVSWAIPKGLTGFSKDAGGSGVRAAIETPVHPINDCLLEGGSVGCKKVDDLGSYRLLRTQREEKDRERLQRQDLYDDETTDEEEEQQAEDEKQEDLLARAYYYASFLPVPFRWGVPAPPPLRKSGSGHRGFVIELNGVRFKGLRLLFHRSNDDFQFQYTKSTSATTHLSNRVTKWMVSLDARSSKTAEDLSFGDRSILTNRTMAQVREQEQGILPRR